MANTTNCREQVFKIVVLLFILVILSSTMGCIHKDFGEPFKEPEPEPLEYEIVNKEGFPMEHIFYTDQDQSLKKSDTVPFYLPANTEWVNFSIKVEINDYGALNFSIFNISSLERYVHVTITDPNDNLTYNKKFFETNEERPSIILPPSGGWVVGVEAVGYGDESNHDSYFVNVVSYEPV